MANIKAAQVKELREKTGVGMMDAKQALVETDGDFDAAVNFLREKGVAKAAKKADRIAAEGLATIHVDGNRAAIIEVNSETDFVAKNEQFQELIAFLAKAISDNNPADLEGALAIEVDGKTIEDTITEATTTIGEKITLRRFKVVEKSDDQVFGDYLHQGGRIAVLTLINGEDAEVARNVGMHVAAINPEYASQDEIPEEAKEQELNILKEQARNEGKPENIIEKMVVGRMNKWLADISLLDQPYVKDGDKKVSEYLEEQSSSLVEFTRYEVGEGIEKREEDFAAEVNSQINK